MTNSTINEMQRQKGGNVLENASYRLATMHCLNVMKRLCPPASSGSLEPGPHCVRHGRDPSSPIGHLDAAVGWREQCLGEHTIANWQGVFIRAPGMIRLEHGDPRRASHPGQSYIQLAM